MKFNKLFKTKNPAIIGAVHFPPLPPHKGFPGKKESLKKTLKDMVSFEAGGVDAIILENNYDIPHTEYLKKETVDNIDWLIKNVKNKTKLPIGLSLLWNDYPNALRLCAKHKLKFIRIPVFIDHIKTHYGFSIKGNPKKVKLIQKKYKASEVLLLCDIHVKHSTILNKDSITQSAKKAINSGADAIIITGKWTGRQPNLKELSHVRKTAGDFPILIGSGLDHKNAKKIFKYANGAIVATSLKSGQNKKQEINIKPWENHIEQTRVEKLTKLTKKIIFHNSI